MVNKREEFNEWVASLAKKTPQLKYWIDTVDDPVCRHTKYRTEPRSATHFKLIYEAIRLRDDPLFPDYDTWTLVPYEYLEADDYKEYADNVAFQNQLEAKEKKEKKLKEELYAKEASIRTLQKEVQQIKDQLTK